MDDLNNAVSLSYSKTHKSVQTSSRENLTSDEEPSKRGLTWRVKEATKGAEEKIIVEREVKSKICKLHVPTRR